MMLLINLFVLTIASLPSTFADSDDAIYQMSYEESSSGGSGNSFGSFSPNGISSEESFGK